MSPHLQMSLSNEAEARVPPVGLNLAERTSACVYVWGERWRGEGRGGGGGELR